MRRADGKHFLARKQSRTVTELRVREFETAPSDLHHIDPQHGEISPMIPTHEFGADAFEVGKSDAEFDRARAGNVGVRQHNAVGAHDEA